MMKKNNILKKLNNFLNFYKMLFEFDHMNKRNVVWN